MKSSKCNNSQIHPEVEHLEYLGLCKSQDEDSAVRQRDTREDLQENKVIIPRHRLIEMRLGGLRAECTQGRKKMTPFH